MVVISDGTLSCSSSSSSYSRSPVPPNFTNSFTTRIFSDIAGDITIGVGGESFLLHKFPLVARCGKIRKMVAEAKGSDLSKMELPNFPGGPHTFELAMKFCYGINFEIATSNVASLRCAAGFLEMTDDYREENLVARTELYLDQVVFHNLEKSAEVLCTCETLPPHVAEEAGIPDRCVTAIAVNACKLQLATGLSQLDCDMESAQLKSDCLEWWIEDLSTLGIDYYRRVISAMVTTGIQTSSIIASLMNYAQESLKGIRKCQILNPDIRIKVDSNMVEKEQREIVEALVSLLPNDKGYSIPLSFLFGMLRVGIVVDTAICCRLELERRIAQQLEMVSLDDLLIPSVRNGDSFYDVDTVHRMLINFLQRVDDEDNEDFGCESETHASLLKVGRIIDAYLTEVAPDPYLSLQKFIAMIEILPDYARVVDDGLYMAIDIYLKAHPSLTEQECKKLCKFIDCQKLSREACNNAAMNDRLPVQMVVQVLYFEQLRLKNTLSGDSGEGLLSSQKINSGLTSGAVSPRDTYASLRRENRELKLEMSRMRVRLSELEKEQMCMREGMMMDKSGNNKTLLASISKGIGRIGIFGGPVGGKRYKTGRKPLGSEAKSGRSRGPSASVFVSVS